jgi:hypothetical protein
MPQADGAAASKHRCFLRVGVWNAFSDAVFDSRLSGGTGDTAVRADRGEAQWGQRAATRSRHQHSERIALDEMPTTATPNATNNDTEVSFVNAAFWSSV